MMGLCFLRIVLQLILACWTIFPLPAVMAQHASGSHGESHDSASAASEHDGHHSSSGEWEGSAAGMAYSEGNHHIAGSLVLLMGLAELGLAFRLSSFGWARFLLPAAMTGTGVFLLIWSDHEAWPVGSLSFGQTFFGQDTEIMQHKIYGILALIVGAIELIRRLELMGHAAWTAPLPLMAIIGGLMLFGHSHGAHPSADKIALHHAVMGTIAMTAGSSKLLGGWLGKPDLAISSRWEVLWAGLIVIIGAQLLIYSE